MITEITKQELVRRYVEKNGHVFATPEEFKNRFMCKVLINLAVADQAPTFPATYADSPELARKEMVKRILNSPFLLSQI